LRDQLGFEVAKVAKPANAPFEAEGEATILLRVGKLRT